MKIRSPVLDTQTEYKAAVTKVNVVVRQRKQADSKSTDMSIPCMRKKPLTLRVFEGALRLRSL
jgi:hypothetical protein